MIKDRLSKECGRFRYKNDAAIIKNIRVSDLLGNTYPEPLEGLVDTGADQSAVPLRICRTLGLTMVDRKPVGGFDEQGRECPVYWVCLIVDGIEDIPLKVLGVRRKSVLVGRDFLKRMVLVMDNRISKYGICRSTSWKTLYLRCIRIL